MLVAKIWNIQKRLLNDKRLIPMLRYLFFFKTGLLGSKYPPTAILLAGIKAGELLYQAHFNANQYNYLEGIVPVPTFTKPVLLIGRENMNRAVNGDVVVVEIFDKKEEWKAPADEVVDQDGKRSSLSKIPRIT